MGPNLRRLFFDDTSGAQDRLQDIFDRHGEALIAALERAQKLLEQCAEEREDPGAAYQALEIEQLLAQLEREAQP